ncbi:MAG: glutaredoxin domain-containing protein [Bacteroidales bacterium]|nr:glutaredoxin family protein [Bacteroidales bacterium]MDD4213429.1 glutaredoxin domain-containing protein [Bacteroidales bacterium]
MKTSFLFTFGFLYSLFNVAQVIDSNKMAYQFFDTSCFVNGIHTITVYSKPGCGRCETVMNVLDKDTIPYQKIILNDSLSHILDAKIFKALPKPGISYGVKYPVLEIDDKLFFYIANHWEFANALKDFILRKK